MDSKDRSTQKDTSSSAVTSSLSHTPGPWSIDDTSGQDLVWADGAIVAHPAHPKNWPADARLIAAAPEMFAALEELLKAEKNRDAAMCGNGGLAILNASNRMSIACIRACDVLAKARSLPAH